MQKNIVVTGGTKGIGRAAGVAFSAGRLPGGYLRPLRRRTWRPCKPPPPSWFPEPCCTRCAADLSEPAEYAPVHRFRARAGAGGRAHQQHRRVYSRPVAGRARRRLPAPPDAGREPAQRLRRDPGPAARPAGPPGRATFSTSAPRPASRPTPTAAPTALPSTRCWASPKTCARS